MPNSLINMEVFMKNIFINVSAIIFALALSGCANLSPGQNQVLGTAAGAAVGGLAGNAIAGNTTGTVIGAVGGAVVGNAVSRSVNPY